MKNISEAVIKRLPKYYRCLKNLLLDGEERVSSRRLSELMDITASQVRQDFSNFGGFGQQGYGYDVRRLVEELCVILGLDEKHSMVIIGAGNIGRALAGYVGFRKEGFYVTALFDILPPSDEIEGIPVYHMDKFEEYVSREKVDIAVIATKSGSAAEVKDRILRAGIKSIWNFAPITLEVPDGVTVESINMSESLYVLSYKMKNEVGGN